MEILAGSFQELRSVASPTRALGIEKISFVMASHFTLAKPVFSY